MHEKIILGNRIPIAEGVYIVDGIPDPILKNQARVSGLRTKKIIDGGVRENHAVG